MSSIRYNQQSMSGVISLDDGSGGLLEDGVLTCVGVVAEDVQTINLNVSDNITAGQSVALMP
jgi:hypothetical protein